jgi:hypothetical protein
MDMIWMRLMIGSQMRIRIEKLSHARPAADQLLIGPLSFYWRLLIDSHRFL